MTKAELNALKEKLAGTERAINSAISKRDCMRVKLSKAEALQSKIADPDILKHAIAILEMMRDSLQKEFDAL